MVEFSQVPLFPPHTSEVGYFAQVGACGLAMGELGPLSFEISVHLCYIAFVNDSLFFVFSSTGERRNVFVT